MPAIICESRAGLTPAIKAALAWELTEVARIEFQSPVDVISVVFHDLEPENTYRSGKPTTETILVIHIREGRSDRAIQALMLGISATWSRITGDPEDHIELVVQQYPDKQVMRGGGRLPEAAQV